MHPVAYGEPRKRVLLITAAALCGVGLAWVLNLRTRPRYEFLAGAHRVEGSLGHVGRGAIDTGADSTAEIYVVRGDWQKVLEKARHEFPRRFESSEILRGSSVAVLTVPRRDGDRIDMMYPPQRTIKILPGNRVATVEVREYRLPSVLETAMTWVHDTFHV